MEAGCKKHANFGVAGSGVKQFCGRHAPVGMVCNPRRGEVVAGVGIPGAVVDGVACLCPAGRGVHRVGVKQLHHVMSCPKRRHTTCVESGCKKYAAFALAGHGARWCRGHAAAGAVDVLSKRCLEAGCDVRASYGMSGGVAQYCVKHAGEGMVDVVNKRCLEAGCDVRASYGVAGGAAEYCVKHAGEAMVDVVTRRCLEAGCDVIPSYGVAGGAAEYCAKHAGEHMVYHPRKHAAKHKAGATRKRRRVAEGE